MREPKYASHLLCLGVAPSRFAGHAGGMIMSVLASYRRVGDSWAFSGLSAHVWCVLGSSAPLGCSMLVRVSHSGVSRSSNERLQRSGAAVVWRRWGFGLLRFCHSFGRFGLRAAPPAEP